jgi:tetratricopeptide (TPR) repeat protein
MMFACPAQGADASALFAEGERAFSAGEYREALQLFEAARDAGSAGAGTYYNIGVCEYRLRDYDAAEATFAALAAAFPALRELAEYNRGLALRADGRVPEARIAFVRASRSADDKIAALANTQLAELGRPPQSAEPSWGGYVSGGLGYDDNVALVDDLLLGIPGSSSSPLAEALGLLTRNFGVDRLRMDLSGYAVSYADAEQFDQSAIRVALAAERSLGSWTLTVGPTIGRSALDGDGFEEAVGADLRVRRSLGERLYFDARVVYDDIEAGDERFAYLEGSRRQLRVAVTHTGAARIRVGYDLESNRRLDPGVSPSRRRWSAAYQKTLSSAWTADTAVTYRDSNYDDASVPREERLLEASFAARRRLRVGWTVSAEYRWFDNDSTVPAFSYDGQRVTVGLARSF